MRVYVLAFLVIGCSLVWSFGAKRQAGGITCSNNVAHYATPSALSKCEGFSFGKSYSYPSDFKYTNDVTWYTCKESNLRIVVSNGIPDHDIKVANPNPQCEIPWYVSVPLQGTYVDELTEPGALGIIAIQLNGVPIYGAQEAEGLNAVQPSSDSPVQDAQYWFGHAAFEGDWHYHNPQVGNEEQPTSETVIAYSLDGFPIYGPLDDNSVLDECNGRVVDGSYQYHAQTLEQVDGTDKEYCNGTSPAIQWNYVIGCYHGSLSNTSVSSSSSASLPSDCVADYFSYLSYLE